MPLSEGDLLLGLGSLAAEPFCLPPGVAGAVGGVAFVPRTAISSVQVSRRLRRYVSVSASTTSSLVSPSTALIRWTT